MRYWTVILIIIFALVSQSPASDVVLGTVISSDPESGKLVIRPIDDKDSEDEKNNNKKTEDITVTAPKGQIFEGIKPGTIIRVWGGYAKDNRMHFQAMKINPGLPPPHNDPTGVRFRLNKCRRLPPRHPGPPRGPRPR